MTSAQFVGKRSHSSSGSSHHATIPLRSQAYCRRHLTAQLFLLLSALVQLSLNAFTLKARCGLMQRLTGCVSIVAPQACFSTCGTLAVPDITFIARRVLRAPAASSSKQRAKPAAPCGTTNDIGRNESGAFMPSMSENARSCQANTSTNARKHASAFCVSRQSRQQCGVGQFTIAIMIDSAFKTVDARMGQPAERPLV